jgi:hypothetical protein
MTTRAARRGRPPTRGDQEKFADRVFLDRPLYEALVEHCTEEGKQKSAVARIALREYAEKRNIVQD